MAKELPYFKFEPSEWQNGDIQMMSPETQLAFLNICCTYWQRKCNLLYAFALQKHCDGNTQILDSLIDCNIIGLSDDNKLQISFLDSQIVEVESKSKSAKKSAEARWAKGSDANAMRTHTDRNAIREDKIREDKIKEEKKDTAKAFNFFSFLSQELNCDKQLLKDWIKVRAKKKATNTETAAKSFITQIEKTKFTADQILTECVERSWAGFKAEWLNKPEQPAAKRTGKDVFLETFYNTDE
jgi:hypothetical protein